MASNEAYYGNYPQKDADIPTFSGDVALYRDWKRSVYVYHAGVPNDKRNLTAPRVLAKLRGAAQARTRHVDPEKLRQAGEAGLTELLDLLDASYEWQPESLLYESLETYLQFPTRKGHERVTSYLSRYHTALQRFENIINDHIKLEAEKKYKAHLQATRLDQLEWWRGQLGSCWLGAWHLRQSHCDEQR